MRTANRTISALLALATWSGAGFARAQIGAGDPSRPNAVEDPSAMLSDRTGGASNSNASAGAPASADRPGSAAGGSDLGGMPTYPLGGTIGGATGGGFLAPGGGGGAAGDTAQSRETPAR